MDGKASCLVLALKLASKLFHGMCVVARIIDGDEKIKM